MTQLKTIIYLFTLMLISIGAQALESQPFDREHFKSLQAKGEVILVDVYASWCSTCKKQQKAIESYVKANPDKKFHILKVDYDKDQATVRALRAPRQGTLLLYKGEKQFWYSVAESRANVIAEELDKAINFKPKS